MTFYGLNHFLGDGRVQVSILFSLKSHKTTFISNFARKWNFQGNIFSFSKQIKLTEVLGKKSKTLIALFTL